MSGWEEAYRKKGWVGTCPFWIPSLLFVLILFPTLGTPRLERLGAPFFQEFGSDWWSSHDILDGYPGTKGFWWGLEEGWTQTGKTVSILEDLGAQVSSRQRQMQASLCLTSSTGVLSAFLPPPHSYFSVSLQRSIFPSLCFPMEKAMAPHSSTLAWKIPWVEEPGRLQSMGSLESDTTEWLHFPFSLACIGEGNGNPLHCSCLQNPRDGGAWWAAVYGVAQSQTRLKWLSIA